MSWYYKILMLSRNSYCMFLLFQMATFTKLQKALLSLGAFSGTLYYLNVFDIDRRTAFASWTTNYTPSTFSKWDDNWDQ